MSMQTPPPAVTVVPEMGRSPSDIGYAAWTTDPLTLATSSVVVPTGDVVIRRMDVRAPVTLTGGVSCYVHAIGVTPGNVLMGLYRAAVAGVCNRIGTSADLSANFLATGQKNIAGAVTLDGGASFLITEPYYYEAYLVGVAWATNPALRVETGASTSAGNGRQTVGTDPLYQARAATGAVTLPNSFTLAALTAAGSVPYWGATF